MEVLTEAQNKSCRRQLLDTLVVLLTNFINVAVNVGRSLSNNGRLWMEWNYRIDLGIFKRVPYESYFLVLREEAKELLNAPRKRIAEKRKFITDVQIFFFK